VTASPWPIVYRGYVNPWDCDEMGHMNVQFHLAKAGEAFEGLLAELGLDAAARTRVKVARHRVRYLKEMHVSDLVRIQGAPVAFYDGRMSAVLDVRNGNDEPCVLVETAAEGVALSMAPVLTAFQSPQGLQPGDEGEGLFEAALSFRETIRNIVRADQCDRDGGLSPRGVMARFSEAQGHLWAMLEAPRAWQRTAGLATATLDYQIRYGAKPEAGAQVRLLTGIAGASAKTIRFRHWLFDAETDELVAAAAGAALFIDRTTRLAVPLPTQVAAAAAGLIG
jgi:acyl-CoA thioester hydrolase